MYYSFTYNVDSYWIDLGSKNDFSYSLAKIKAVIGFRFNTKPK